MTREPHNDDSRNVCSNCKLPPKQSCIDGVSVPIKLRSCGRCKRAWYHDVECQRAHFKEHKKDCEKLLLGIAPEPYKQVSFIIQPKDGRGRCMVASTDITKNTLIGNFGAMVPPVLLEPCRSKRCALCAGQLNPQTQPLTFSTNLNAYPIYFCSLGCKLQGNDFFQEEQESVASLVNTIPQIRILPTAILLSRLVKALVKEELTTKDNNTHSLRTNIEKLQSHEYIADESYTHAMLTTVQHMVQSNSVWTESSFLLKLLAKIQTNAFSICDGEQIAIGIGLYGAAAAMVNHSCNPNALQTFQLGNVGIFPTLRLTTCTSIAVNEEICISYIDNTCPCERRRKDLQTNYRFHCLCMYCLDDERETIVVGLSCSKKGCHGFVLPRDGMLTCRICDNTQDQDTLAELDAKISTSTFNRSELQYQYDSICNTCSPSSWYVQNAAEQLLETLLSDIGACECEPTRMELCYKAIALVDHMLQSQGDEDWRTLTKNVLRLKAAKLRLFVQPDPRHPIQELQSCLAVVKTFYCENHELVTSIKSSLDQAFS